MTKIAKLMFTGAALAAFLLPAAAQSSTSTPSPTQPAPNAPVTVGDRKENQQDRIANGINNGSLTAGEAANLESKEAKLNKETQAMRAADGGKLTAADKQKLQQQQNRLSNAIYKDKHNAQVANTNDSNGNLPGNRAENQQDRIAQGIKSGQLTPGEAAKLENHEAKLNKEIGADRAANGGTLTQSERQQIAHQQNRMSNNIYHQKHDAQRQRH
jgi:hypothetical protein